jgi:hypothetical protein
VLLFPFRGQGGIKKAIPNTRNCLKELTKQRYFILLF